MTLYVTRDLFKARVSIPDEVDDAIIDSTLESVCRDIDIFCGHTFYVTRGVRYYAAAHGSKLLVDDLLSVTALETDGDGDRVYETSWAPTDYDLMPDNALYTSPPSPYWKIETTPMGRFSFPRHHRAIKITGLWGYYDVRRVLSATISDDYLSTDTALQVSAVSEFQAGQVLWIGDEQLEVTAVTDNEAPTPDTITVRRGMNGTTAAAISSGAAIQLATFPIVSEAAILMAQRHFHRKASPFGIEGTDQLGAAMRIPVIDPDVRRMLSKFVLAVVS